jgi:5-methylcytosine-specific restriction endonuclease McrA
MAYKGDIPLDKRDPVSHRTGKQQRSKQTGYNSTPREKAKNNERHQARREMAAAGRVSPGDGREVDHKKPLDKGGSNARSNLQVLTRRQNRSKGSTEQ